MLPLDTLFMVGFVTVSIVIELWVFEQYTLSYEACNGLLLLQGELDSLWQRPLEEHGHHRHDELYDQPGARMTLLYNARLQPVVNVSCDCTVEMRTSRSTYVGIVAEYQRWKPPIICGFNKKNDDFRLLTSTHHIKTSHVRSEHAQ